MLVHLLNNKNKEEDALEPPKDSTMICGGRDLCYCLHDCACHQDRANRCTEEANLRNLKMESTGMGANDFWLVAVEFGRVVGADEVRSTPGELASRDQHEQVVGYSSVKVETGNKVCRLVQ